MNDQSIINTRLYRIWANMKSRCYNHKHNQYCRYGKRGITICDEWKNNFCNFYCWSIKNGYKDNLTIDRIDNNGDYEPNNCRWITQKEQSNNRENNHYITYNNLTLTIAQWAEKIGINVNTLRRRIQMGWEEKRALETPSRKRKKYERNK